MVSSGEPSLSIGYLPVTDHLSLAVTYTRDRLRFRHFRLIPRKFHSWDALAEALKGSEVDGAFILAPLAFHLRSEGLPIKVLSLANREGSIFVVSNEITSIENLKGRSVAIPHKYSVQHLLLHQIVFSAGLVLNRDVFVQVLDPSDMVTALSKGEIHGFVVAEPHGSQAEEQKIGRVFATSDKILGHHLCCIFVVHERVVAKVPLLEEFLESLVSSAEFIHSNPELACEMGSEILGQSPRVLLKALSTEGRRVILWDLIPVVQEFKALHNQCVNVLKLPMSGIVMEQFLEEKFILKAYESVQARRRLENSHAKKLRRVVYPLLFLLAFLLLWEFMIELLRFDQDLFPGPRAVGRALLELVGRGKLWIHLSSSLLRVIAGYLIGLLLGIPLGFLVGGIQNLRFAVDPFVEFVRTISPISWIPLAILWFGIGNAPAIFIIAIATFFPVFVAASNSIKNIDPVFLKLAKNFGASRIQIFCKVVLPASLPFIFVGLRIALGLGWVVVVAAEMVGLQSGLGYLVLDSRNMLRTDLVVACMVVIGVVGFLLNCIIGAFEQSIRYRRYIETL